MKTMKAMILAVLAMFGVWGLTAQAVTVTPLSTEEQAQFGANTLVELTYADLEDSTDVNTPQTNAVLSIPANTLVEFKYALLRVPFTTANDSVYTNSLTAVVGDGTDADLFLASTQLAEDNTEVYVATPAQAALTATATITKDTISMWGTNVMTNAYATITMGGADGGVKWYTSADTVDLVLTPSATLPLSANTGGKLRLFFNVLRQN